MKKFHLMLVVLIVVSAGCSTIQGIGQDIKGLGNGIAGIAEKTHDGLTKSER